jgi:hypothetical protein
MHLPLSIQSALRTLIALTVALACAPISASAQSGDVSTSVDRVAPRQDLRSPDTRDVADGREYPPTPTVRDRALRSSQGFTDDQRRLVERFKRGSSYREALTAAHQATLKELNARQPASATGFDWFAAAAGAAAALGLILLMTAGVLLVRRRAQREQPIAVS